MIDSIRQAFREGRFRYTQHALEKRVERGIHGREIVQAIVRGEIIEDYPEDKYGPSCLVFGLTESGRPLHVQVGISPVMTVVTVYEPDPERWTEYKKRRK